MSKVVQSKGENVIVVREQLSAVMCCHYMPYYSIYLIMSTTMVTTSMYKSTPNHSTLKSIHPKKVLRTMIHALI